MLKCNIKRGGNIRVKASGTPQDLMVETAAAIKEIYDGINKTSQVAANEYKLKLIGLLLDPDSPVWKGDTP